MVEVPIVYVFKPGMVVGLSHPPIQTSTPIFRPVSAGYKPRTLPTSQGNLLVFSINFATITLVLVLTLAYNEDKRFLRGQDGN